MSSSKTTNYGLHIWAPEDNFVRTEFNENSQKLDAALKAQSTALNTAVSDQSAALSAAVANQSAAISALKTYELLVDTTTSGSSTQVSASLSGIRFGDWHHLEGRFYVPRSTGTLYLRANSLSGTVYYAAGLNDTSNQPRILTYISSITWSDSKPVEVQFTLPLFRTEWGVTVYSHTLALPPSWCWSTQAVARVEGLSWSQLRTIDLVGNIPGGTHVQVWGVK